MARRSIWAQVKSKLGGARVLYMQATETSTGARHDVKGVAQLLKGTDTLLVVDGITGLGTTYFDVDGWGIDVLIGGSQKAVMIPPGLAYLSVSERAWKRADEAKQPRYYFDLRKERKAAAKGESAFTPATALVAGLLAALDYIRKSGNGDLSAGRDALIHNAETSAAMVRAGAKALGLKLFAPSCPAAAVTAVLPPDGVDSSALVKEFRERFAMVVANGQGEMKGKMIRIAHLGYYDYLDAIGVIGALEHVLLKVAPAHRFELGAGVRAAQEVLAEPVCRNGKGVEGFRSKGTEPREYEQYREGTLPRGVWFARNNIAVIPETFPGSIFSLHASLGYTTVWNTGTRRMCSVGLYHPDPGMTTPRTTGASAEALGGCEIEIPSPFRDGTKSRFLAG